jgi:N-acylneuraminate cytidylyltransferase
MSSKSVKPVAFIFARGGSKGVPGKNIKLLGGKPLIAHAINIGLATPNVETVIVSTDDLAIAEVARAHGAEVPFMRPLDLALDHSPEWLAWRHAINWYRKHRGDFDVFVSLPTTSPFRSVHDVASTIQALTSTEDVDIAITVTEANRSPYFNMVKIDPNGYSHLVIPPASEVFRRQDAPVVFDITTVAYAARPQFVLENSSIFAGRVKAVQVPRERSLDIDTPFDFLVAEALAALILQKKIKTESSDYANY